ncbi:MAG: SRPBCC family protein, partial [Alphaproteobacteria bacterium]
MARTYKKVGEDFVKAGGGRTVTFDLPFSAADAFTALGNADSWKAWMDLEVTWTSPQPFGVGTTRTVIAAGQSMDEEFFAWDEGKRMAFCFVEGGLPVKAMIEDYVLED